MRQAAQRHAARAETAEVVTAADEDVAAVDMRPEASAPSPTAMSTAIPQADFMGTFSLPASSSLCPAGLRSGLPRSNIITAGLSRGLHRTFYLLERAAARLTARAWQRSRPGRRVVQAESTSACPAPTSPILVCCPPLCVLRTLIWDSVCHAPTVSLPMLAC